MPHGQQFHKLVSPVANVSELDLGSLPVPLLGYVVLSVSTMFGLDTGQWLGFTRVGGQLSLAPDFAPNSMTVVDLSPVPPGWTIGLELLFYLLRAVHCAAFDLAHRVSLRFFRSRDDLCALRHGAGSMVAIERRAALAPTYPHDHSGDHCCVFARPISGFADRPAAPEVWCETKNRLKSFRTRHAAGKRGATLKANRAHHLFDHLIGRDK